MEFGGGRALVFLRLWSGFLSRCSGELAGEMPFDEFLYFSPERVRIERVYRTSSYTDVPELGMPHETPIASQVRIPGTQ